MHFQLKRRITHGTNVALAVLAFAGLVVFVNYLTAKYPKSYDFIQKTELYKISDKTKNVLDEVAQRKTLVDLDGEVVERVVPVELYWFSKPGESELYDKVKRLFKSYKDANNIVKFNIINEVTDVIEARTLVKELQIDDPDTVVVVYGDNKALLTEMDLADFKFDHDNYTGGQIKNMVAFKAEQAITSAIIDLLDSRKIQARFTIKHGEKSIHGYDDDGFSEARRYLERDNIEAKPIELISLKSISPTNVELLVIAGPTREFLAHEVNVIRNYLNNGGRALIMLDPENKTGLEPLLREFNLNVGNDIVVDPSSQMPGVSPLKLVVGQYLHFPVTDNLGTYTIYSLARSITVINEENDVNKGYNLAVTSEKGWGETDLSSAAFKFDEEQDNLGPVCIAAAVKNKKSGMRMIVVGDSDFAATRDFFQGANNDFFMNSVNWLLDRENLVAISPKTLSEQRRLRLSANNMLVIRNLVILAVPGISIIVGIIVYFIRRK